MWDSSTRTVFTIAIPDVISDSSPLYGHFSHMPGSPWLWKNLYRLLNALLDIQVTSAESRWWYTAEHHLKIYKSITYAANVTTCFSSCFPNNSAQNIREIIGPVQPRGANRETCWWRVYRCNRTVSVCSTASAPMTHSGSTASYIIVIVIIIIIIIYSASSAASCCSWASAQWRLVWADSSDGAWWTDATVGTPCSRYISRTFVYHARWLQPNWIF